jgi:hypothetical protein
MLRSVIETKVMINVLDRYKNFKVINILSSTRRLIREERIGETIFALSAVYVLFLLYRRLYVLITYNKPRYLPRTK